MRKNSRVTSIALSIALGGFLFGYDIAMVSGTTARSEWISKLSKSLLRLIVTIVFIGTIVSAFIY